MKIFRWEELLADGGIELSGFLRSHGVLDSCGTGLKAFSAITVGDFDGCHLGHAALFEKIVAASKKSFLEVEKNKDSPCILVPGAVTFRRQPSSPEKNGKPVACISTLNQRFKAMERCGLAFVVLIDFSYNFSRIKGYNFLKSLAEKVCMRYLCVGRDFRCGCNIDTGYAEISQVAAKLGFAFDPADQVEIDGSRASSTRIREAILSADFFAANRLMGRAFTLDLSEVSWRNLAGEGRKESASAVCAPIAAFSQILPPAGKYSARLLLDGLSDGKESVLECLCSIGGQDVLLEYKRDLSLCGGKIVENGTDGPFFDSLEFCKRY